MLFLAFVFRIRHFKQRKKSLKHFSGMLCCLVVYLSVVSFSWREIWKNVPGFCGQCSKRVGPFSGNMFLHFVFDSRPPPLPNLICSRWHWVVFLYFGSAEAVCFLQQISGVMSFFRQDVFPPLRTGAFLKEHWHNSVLMYCAVMDGGWGLLWHNLCFWSFWCWFIKVYLQAVKSHSLSSSLTRAVQLLRPGRRPAEGPDSRPRLPHCSLFFRSTILQLNHLCADLWKPPSSNLQQSFTVGLQGGLTAPTSEMISVLPPPPPSPPTP